MTLYDAAMDNVRINERRVIFRFGPDRPRETVSLAWPNSIPVERENYRTTEEERSVPFEKLSTGSLYAGVSVGTDDGGHVSGLQRNDVGRYRAAPALEQAHSGGSLELATPRRQLRRVAGRLASWLRQLRL